MAAIWNVLDYMTPPHQLRARASEALVWVSGSSMAHARRGMAFSDAGPSGIRVYVQCSLVWIWLACGGHMLISWGHMLTCWGRMDVLAAD